jgi:hypothetical protein
MADAEKGSISMPIRAKDGILTIKKNSSLRPGWREHEEEHGCMHVAALNMRTCNSDGRFSPPSHGPGKMMWGIRIGRYTGLRIVLEIAFPALMPVAD